MKNPKIHWCTPVTGGERLKLVEYEDYKQLQEEKEELQHKIELLERCRDYDVTGENRPEGYIVPRVVVALRQDGKD